MGVFLMCGPQRDGALGSARLATGNSFGVRFGAYAPCSLLPFDPAAEIKYKLKYPMNGIF